ncbi:MAG: GNAT family N-acetyltransferase [Actinomycetota bacterium]|nr:GNAT family N-acetyltransferase [Actinomycetota bacterium]
MSTTTVTSSTVRKATAADAPRLSETLGDAFFHDPVISWCYPDDDRRAVLLPAGFRVILDTTIPGGGVDTVTDEIAGAVWIPPDVTVDQDRMGEDLVAASAEYAERIVTLMELLGEHHPEDEPHQYLFILGTRTEWQSRGLGSALLRSVLGECDDIGMPAYLEATSERNRQLYQRQGFKVTEEIHLPDGPPLWCMWRTPRGER